MNAKGRKGNLLRNFVRKKKEKRGTRLSRLRRRKEIGVVLTRREWIKKGERERMLGEIELLSVKSENWLDVF